MLKYLLLIFSLILSACTRQATTPGDILPILSGEQAQMVNMNTSMLLWNMDILEQYFTGGVVVDNPVYSEAYSLLKWVESQCVWGNFEEFRICLIDWLSGIRDDFDEVTGQWRDIDTYINTIRSEIEYIDYYKVLDEQPMSSDYYRSSLWGDTQWSKSCYSIMTGSASYPRPSYDPGEDITIPIDLWFQDTAYRELTDIFPSWQSSREILMTRESYNCSWMTFWPGNGTIFYVFEEGNIIYLFIKDADGGWSGDFNYSIFAYSKDTQKFMHLWSFYAYSGIIPLPLVLNNENGEAISAERRTILWDYRNRTFLYTSYIYEPMYSITSKIKSLLEKSIE